MRTSLIKSQVKLRGESATEGMPEWLGLPLGHKPFAHSLGALSYLADVVYWVLLAWILHLPPSAVSLVSDVRFYRSA